MALDATIIPDGTCAVSSMLAVPRHGDSSEDDGGETGVLSVDDVSCQSITL